MKMTRQYNRVFVGNPSPHTSAKVTIALEGTKLDYSVTWSHPPTPRMLDEYYDWRGSVVSDWETATGIKLLFDDQASASYKASSPCSQTLGAD